MKYILRNMILIATFALAVETQAQSGGTQSPFALGIGSRDLALGGADISYCDFATASYWNPARLAQSEQYSVMGYYTRLYDSDIAYQYLGFVIPTLDWGAVGVGITRMGINDIEKRDATNLLLDSISDNRLGVRVGYGRTVGSLDLGASFSMETHSLDSYRATSSPGLDLAVTRMVPSPVSWCDNVSLSLVGRNVISPNMRLVDESVESPLEISSGISSKFLLSESGSQSLELSGSISKPRYSPAMALLGMEFSLFDVLQLRGSFRDDKFSGGVGISYSGISFDYAVVDRELGAIHMISITTNIGKSVSERRSIRAGRREAAFNNAMSDRLTQKNIELASQLLEAGKRALAGGDLTTADDSFDRSLFLTRSAGIDTTECAALAKQVRAQIDRKNQSIKIAEYLESASASLENLDYMGCQYYAGLALSIDSTSEEAADLRNRAISATAQVSQQQDFVQRRVWLIDSLISYGEATEALSTARSLHTMSPQYPVVQLALKRAEFEFFKTEAEKELQSREFQRCLALLDSALIRFNGHARCLELQKVCTNALRQSQTVGTQTPFRPVQLSREDQKQAQTRYDRAQGAFNRGDLTLAIAEWEEVERVSPGYQSVREYLLKAYRFVGVDLYGQNRLDEALVIWDKALKLEPNNAEISAYARRTRNEIEKLKELSYDN